MGDDPEKDVVEPTPHMPNETLAHSKEDSSNKDHGTRQARDNESLPSRGSTDTIAPVEEDGGEPRNVKSNASSIPGPLVIVSREKRRGLLGRFALIPEVENPQLYRRKMKWILTLFVALAAAAGPMGSSILIREYYA